MFKHNAYLIETITNTHVGAGDTNYGVIDNMIQRDSRSGFPIVHPSSIKGAVRDHFKQLLKDASKDIGIKDYTIEAVFGEEKKDWLIEKANHESCDPVDKEQIDFLLKNTPRQGLIKFFEACLLTIPLRSTKKVFHHATCPYLAIDYLENLKQFHVVNDACEIDMLIRFFIELRTQLSSKNKEFIVFSGVKPVIEDYENLIHMTADQINALDDINDVMIRSLISKYFSPHQYQNYMDTFAVFHDDLFQHICTSGMPVIARNKLSDEGKSENLFYEEILPRRSVLWFMNGIYQFPETNFFYEQFEQVEKILLNTNIQIGANASVGYGVTLIHKIKGGSHEQAKN
jgi:CRISPR-associated protein Cmr4